jgi:hypothetical protein
VVSNILEVEKSDVGFAVVETGWATRKKQKIKEREGSRIYEKVPRFDN